MNILKAVVFDADGTLLDSFELIKAAYRHVAETHGLRIPDSEELRVQMGNPLPEIFRSLYPDADISTLLETNSVFVSENQMKSEAYRGLSEMLENLKAKGLKLAILTSGGPKIVDLLKHHGIDSYFSSVVHHERITDPKPHSEGFTLATKECGVKNNEAIMVGDTVVDIQTGKNASAYKTIAVTHGFGHIDDLTASGADYIADDLVSVEKIIVGFVNE